MKRGRLVTIGSFDGVHRGHQALLERTVLEARKRDMRSLALSFAVPPRMVLDESARKLLLSDEFEKEQLIRSYGIDEVAILRFDRGLAETRPFGFFRDVLLNEHGAKGIVVGADFRFGAGRSAGAVELVRWGLDFRVPVWVIPPVRFRRKVVSSTMIRALVEHGSYRSAIDFLGHPYLISGKVISGRGVGKTLGFPTANLQTRPEKILPVGVFAVKAGIGERPFAKKTFDGVANIGVRPTFGVAPRPVVEVHLLTPAGDLKGKRLSIQLVKRIRSERRFPSVEALKRQIGRDVQAARKAL